MTKDYDGFYFLPGDEDNQLTLSYFKLNEEFVDGKPVDFSSVGDMFHIAFFKWSDGGNPVFDEHFEAIFTDPSTYIRGLAGADLYGCVLRKTDKSAKWWEDYLARTILSCTMVESKV